MAGYRTFRNEAYYEAPGTTPFDGAQGLISNIFQNMRKRQDERRRAADQFQYDLDKGAYENDTKILNEMAKNVTARAKNEIRTGGRVSIETDRLMKDGLAWQTMSKNQLERER